MLKRVLTNLTFWVLVSIMLGIICGIFFKDAFIGPFMEKAWKARFFGQDLEVGPSLSEVFSKGFVSLVKLLINPIIFMTITLGIVNMGDLKKVGRLGLKAFIYFEVVTTFALVIGVVVSYVIQPGRGVVPQNDGAPVTSYADKAASFSWMDFLQHNSTIQVLIVAILVGVITSYLNKGALLARWLSPISSILFKILHRLMLLAPIGAFGGMAYTIGKYGLTSLLPLGKLMMTVYITMAVFILVVLWLILRMYQVRLWSFLTYIREELLIVLGTSSSESALPNLIEKLEKMGCEKSVVGMVVPAGYSFNLDGTTIYLSMAVLFLAQVYAVHLSWAEVLTIIGVLMVTSKGAAGVTGSGFIVLASTLVAVKTIPVEGLALLLGVDRFMSEARAITNFIGNGVATIWISNNEKSFDRQKMNYAFSHLKDSESILKDNLEADQ